MRKKTTAEFINEATTTHGNRYDYSLVEYTGALENVKIICYKHGEFNQQANRHIRGSNCPKCARHRVSTNDFIEKAKIIHGDKYDYRKVSYKHHAKKVRIICYEHGEFQQRPNDHLCGKGCRSCNKSKGENLVADFLSRLGIEYIREWWHTECRREKPLPFDFFLIVTGKQR